MELGGGVDVEFRSPAGTAPDSQTGVGERRDGDAPGGRSRVMCHGEQLSMDIPSRPVLGEQSGGRGEVSSRKESLGLANHDERKSFRKIEVPATLSF